MMFRRVVSVIVLFGFVAGHLAAIPHAHAESLTTIDRDARPHIHLSWFDHSSHEHEKTHHHRHHHHAMPIAQTQYGDLDPFADDDGHDGDAIYFSCDVRVAVPAVAHVPAGDLQVLTTLQILGNAPTLVATESAISRLFLAECSPAQPLYLALRALRI
jgi:hypothetical protein